MTCFPNSCHSSEAFVEPGISMNYLCAMLCSAPSMRSIQASNIRMNTLQLHLHHVPQHEVDVPSRSQGFYYYAGKQH